MRVTEIIDAVQWFPDIPHPQVTTSIFESGMSIIIYEEEAHKLREAKGQLGWLIYQDEHDTLSGTIVEPGDWIIYRNDAYELVKKDDFSKRFEPK